MKRKIQWKKRTLHIGGAVAAALVISIILPNTNSRIAYAMEQIPLIGRFFQVVTVRNYEYDDGHSRAQVEVPEILPEGEGESTAAGQVNKSADEYISSLMAQFETDVEETGQGYQNLDVSYEVVTDTDTWFTLRINGLEVKAGGYEFSKFYHIDKASDRVVTLGDILKDDSVSKKAISDNIREQMKTQMKEDESKVYWVDSEEYPEDNFREIKEEQNFYFNDLGQLVIVFDEYEVAPGYMGASEFVIPEDVVSLTH